MTDAPVAAVCCDLTGVVVADDGILERAFAEAIATQGVVPGTVAYARSMAEVHRSRGRAPIDVMHHLFGGDEARAQAAHLAFERSYHAVVERFGVSVTPGAVETFDRLRDVGVPVCLMSGLSRASSGAVLDRVGIQRRVDLILCLDDVPRGYPWPDLVLTAVLRLGVADVRSVAVVGDTESVISCGLQAGAGVVAAVRTGARPVERLRRAGATHLLGAITELPDLLRPPTVPPPRMEAAQEPRGGTRHPKPPAPATGQRSPSDGIPPQVPFRERNAGL